MQEKNNKVWLCVMLLLISVATLQAQTKYSKSNYKKKPLWIQMMQDPNANFFETVKAFKLFFEEHPLPKEPGEAKGGDAFEKELGLNEKDQEDEKKREDKMEKQRTNQSAYVFQVRQFKSWYFNTKPWVRTDGSIITLAQRQAMINKQQAELKETERANGKN